MKGGRKFSIPFSLFIQRQQFKLRTLPGKLHVKLIIQLQVILSKINSSHYGHIHREK